MKLVSYEKIEDCFDGSGIFLFHFGEALKLKDIQILATVGKLEYFPDFPRPFFRIISLEGMQIKGVEGDETCRIIFPKNYQLMITQLLSLIEKSL